MSKVTTQPELSSAPPQQAFQTDFIDTSGVSHDVSSDAQNLYVIQRTHQPDAHEIRVVQNWFEEIK